MSLNTAHASNGVLIHAGEYILIFSDCVTMDFSGQDNPVFKGSKQGRIYLTSHRMIFNNKKPADDMQSFSAPFIAMSDVDIEQPVFGANYIKGKVRAQPNGNFVGEVKFKLHFKAGGAIEYGQTLLRAATTAQSNMRNGNFSDDPPPYTPSGAWHEAPPPAYQPPPGYYGWVPQHDAFTGPPPNSVFMSDNPPPYPGIGGPPAYNPAAQQPPPQQQTNWQPQQNDNWNGFSAPPTGQPPQQPQQPQQNDAEISWHGFSAPPPEQPAQQPQQPPQQQQWGGGGYQPPQPQQQWGGYQPPPYAAAGGGFGSPAGQPGGFMMPGGPQQPGYNPGYPGAGYQGYPGGGPAPPQGGYPYPGAGVGGGAAAGAMGFSAPPANSKEAEALASANNTPYNQRNDNPGAGGMPPSYNDLPPSYNDWSRKNQ